MKKSEKMKMGILVELVIFVVVLCVAAGRTDGADDVQAEYRGHGEHREYGRKCREKRFHPLGGFYGDM